MTRVPLKEILRVRPEESDAIQIGTVGGRVTEPNSRAAQIVRTYFLTEEIRGHLRKILESIARGNTPGAGHLECNSWLLDAGIGAGKSHFLAFLMVLLVQKDAAWLALIDKEDELAPNQRLDDKVILTGIESKRHLVVPIDLTVHPTEQSLAQILTLKMKDVYQSETGKSLALEPDERLIEEFYKMTDIAQGFRKFLATNGVDEKKEGSLRRNSSQLLADWIRRYYHERLGAEPRITASWDESLQIGCESSHCPFDGGTVFIVDELSRYMARRKQSGQDEADITTLQRISRNYREQGMKVWLVATENVATSREVTQQVKGPGSIQTMSLRREDFKDIVLYRCRSLPEGKTERDAAIGKIEVYWAMLKPKLDWVNSLSLDEFLHFFPYEPTLIDLTQRVCERMAETRTGIQILHSVLRRRQADSRLITADMVFDELEGKVDQADAKANLFEESVENRAIYAVFQDIVGRINRSGDIPDGFKPKAINAVKALVLYHFAQRDELVSTEEIVEILSEEWNDNADRKMAVILFTGMLDKLPTISQGHIEKDKGGYRFSVEGQISIKPDWDAEIDRLNNRSGGYSARELLRQLMTTDKDLQEGFLDGLSLDSSRSLSFKGLAWKGFSVKGVGRLIDLEQASKLDPPNKRDNNQDFALYVAVEEDAAKVGSLLAYSNDDRIILWCPKPLTDEEVGDLRAYEALLEIRKRYAKGQNKDDADRQAKADSEVSDRKPKIINLVKAALNNGTLKTHTQSLNVGKADVQTAVTAAVPAVLDDVYREHGLTISGNQTLDDAGVLKLANGLIRHERYVAGAIDNATWDAARSFAKPLELSSSAATPELDIGASTWVARIQKQIECSGDSATFLELREQFCDKPFGLSPRLLSLYLLAMARKAEVVLEAKGDLIVSKNTIESGMTFASGSKGIIDEILTVRRSKAPEPWDKILSVANLLLYPNQAQAIRSDENYARIARDVHVTLAAERERLENMVSALERFVSGACLTTEMPVRLLGLKPLLALTDLDKNPSNGLVTLWTTARDIWGEDLMVLELLYSDYRKVKAFLEQRKDDVVLFARQIAAQIPAEADPRWAEIRLAGTALHATLNAEDLIRDDGKWGAFDQTQKKLREAYAAAYTEAHATYYQSAGVTREELQGLLIGPELACLAWLETVPEINSGAAVKADQGIRDAIEASPGCHRVLDAQLKTAVTCECDFHLTQSYSSDASIHWLLYVEAELRKGLGLLQSPEIKSHFLAFPGSEEAAGLRELLAQDPKEIGRLPGLATVELVEFIRKALAALRTVDLTLGGLPLPPSFQYGDTAEVIATLASHIKKLTDEAIDRAGFRSDVDAGMSVVVRVAHQ